MGVQFPPGVPETVSYEFRVASYELIKKNLDDYFSTRNPKLVTRNLFCSGSPSLHEVHEGWMRWAIREAERAYDDGEVPVGAVVVHENRIIGRAHNQTETLRDPTAHAEMIAISAAANTLQLWRLTECTLYATLEPCAMCAGAAVLARIQNLVFGAWDPKAGACGSLRNLVQDQRLNHRIEVVSGVLEGEIADLMKSFFQNLREKQKRSIDSERKPGKDPWIPD